MTSVYDNWERLVKATLDREKLRQIALAPSRETSFSSSISDLSNSSYNFEFKSVHDGNGYGFTKPIKLGDHVTRPIILADQVIKVAEDVASFQEECLELMSKAEKLSRLLRQVARERAVYEPPTRRIMNNTGQVLEKTLTLVLKFRGHGIVKRVFTIIPAADFRKLSSQLESSIEDVSWLLRVSASADYRAGDYLGLPPIAADEPILCLIWEHIAILYTGSADDRSGAAASLVSLAQDNDRYGKLIIEEGGVGLLLKLVKEGKLEGQENAARAIGWLGKNPESVEHMIHAGVCSVFANILREGPMKFQAVVAWAVSELAIHHPKCQDLFAQHNVIRLLIYHLAFEALQEHSKYAVVSKATSMHAAVVLVSSDKAREMEQPATKAYMKAMAARALGYLAKGNSPICRSITESRALLCFSVLLENGPEEVQYNCAMALTEITAVAEEDAELRRSAFKPNLPGCKAVVDQLFRIIDKADSEELLVQCIKAIGNLARTFKATETRMINPLVKLLDEREAEVSREACIALSKFACSENFLCFDHSKAIIGAGGAKHLVQLVYFGEQIVKSTALILLCYIAMHVPDSCAGMGFQKILFVPS